MKAKTKAKSKETIKELRKATLKLDTSGINEDAPSEKELAKRGLAPNVKNVWSLVEDGD